MGLLDHQTKTQRVCLMVALLAAASSCGGGRHSEPGRTYRIGFGNDRPFHYLGADGQPTGLAVEIVKEAARRRGIRLEWIRTTRGYEEILQNRVDLHVLISVLPERRKFVYLSEPYLTTETGFLVAADSRYRTVADLGAARIALLDLDIHRQTLARMLPGATLIRLQSADDVIAAVHDGRADAAYVDQYAGISALMDGAAKSPLRIVASHVPRRFLALASSFQTQGVAEELRDEIGALSERQELAPVLAHWSLFPALMADSADALNAERRKVRLLESGAAALLLLLLVVVWLLWRLRSRSYSLRMSETRYRTVVESLGDGVATVDAEGRFLLSNPAADGLFGVPSQGLVGRGLEEFLIPEAGHAGAGPSLQSGEKIRFQVAILRPDGTRRNIQVSSTPQFDRGGRRSGALVVLRDITGAKELEEQIRLLAQALRCADDCITVTDAQDRLLYVNDAFLRTYGYEKREVLGRNIDFVRSLREGGDGTPNFRALEHWRGELWNRARDGREFLISLATAKVRDDDGATIGLIGVARDITELKWAEEERIRLQAQLTQAQKMESIGSLAGGVAHDFNNLLTVINGYSDMILAAANLTPEKLRIRVGNIRKAGERAAQLTQQLLAFSRKQVIQPQQLDLNAVVVETRGMLVRVLPENIEIVCQMEENLGRIMADPGQMQQVLMNLAVNARDAMPNGGKLTMETRNVTLDARAAAEHSEGSEGPCVMLAVSDTGVGMEPEVAQRVFEPFFTTKALGAGTGLGLATVYGIVRQNGGWISVDSEPGRGSSFRIYFPLLTAAVAHVEPEVSANRHEGSETILVVEDQDDLRALATEVLEGTGYRVLSAPNGARALSLAREFADPIDLLLTDVVMPGLSGNEVAERLLEQRPGVKVLYMSGYSEDVIVTRGVLKPGIAYLPKPLTPDTLLAKVAEVLGARV